jgi:hypothetical protein
MSKLLIRLGNDGLRYAQACSALKLLGTVQDGLAMGALAQLVDGSYAQVNGDFVRPLSTSRVEFAINARKKQASRQTTAPGAPTASRSRPGNLLNAVVVVKRRRLVPNSSV